MKLSHYLQRIKYAGTVAPSVATLTALQEAHARAVPFENLDVQLGQATSIRIEDAYEKIVGNARGGWCYEQNGLFGWALAEMGFGVTRIAASVMRAQRGAASEASHLCLLVTASGSDSQYLADVGFGGSMIRPIPLQEGEYAQSPFTLGLERLDEHYWRFWEGLGGKKFSFDFTEDAACEAALAKKCEKLQSDPTSDFVLNLVAQQRSRNEHYSLRGRVLSVVKSNGTTSTTLDSPEALVSVLENRFQLNVFGVAELWPGIVARHEKLFGTGA